MFMGIVSELRRRNVHRMALLYLGAAWLIMQVVDLLIDRGPLPESVGPITLTVLAIGFPIALTFSWFYELTPEGMKLEKDVDAAESITHATGRRLDFVVISLLAAAVLVFAYDKWWLPDPPDQSVAILPFVNMSGDPNNEYLSDGITETLLDAVSQLPGLKVPARTSSFFFKGKDIDIREIALQLGVAYVLEGSVQRAGDKLRVVAQLIEAETGFHRWSKTYDRDMNDIFAVQDDIATSVARAMQVTLSDDPGQGGGKIGTIGTDNVTAYDRYLKGLEQQNRRSYTSLLHAEISFKEALALDPDFFEARLELASTYMNLGSTGERTMADAVEKAAPLVDRLLEEQPDDEAALIMVGWVRYTRAQLLGDGSFDLDKHLAQLSAAIERTPNDSDLYNAFSGYLQEANRLDESFKWMEQGITVDPLNWRLHARLGGHLIRAWDFDGAEAAFARAVELNPDNPSLLAKLASVYWMRKQFSLWFAMNSKAMDLDPLDAEFPASWSINLRWFGLFDEADRYLERAIAIAPDTPVVRAANLYRELLHDQARARDLSRAMLQDNIENRGNAYRYAAIVFVSTTTELGEIDAALAVLEELHPGVTSPDFEPQTGKQMDLHFVAVLALAQSQSREKTLRLLEAVVPRWDRSFPDWRRHWKVAAIEMVRGNTELAIELALKNLGDVEEAVRYRHLYFWKALAREPAVAARLTELDAEAKRGGEEIWAYIVEHDLQL
jgi:TolB-like protein/Tfp pilus assembly protein PilF